MPRMTLRTHSVSALCLAASAGVAAAAPPAPAPAYAVRNGGAPTTAAHRSRVGGDVYVGQSGDMVLIPAGAVRDNLPNAGTTEPLWLSSKTDYCEGLGTDPNPLFGIDSGTDTDGDGYPEGTFTDVLVQDWGDLPFDSYVCGMRILAGTTEPTPDTDGDGVPESIAGTSYTVTFTDNDDGFGFGASFGTPVAAFNLPMFGDPTPSDSYVTAFYYTYDFVEDFTDNSGNPVDASFTLANSATTSDIDGDGLGDFGYGLEFEFADANADGQPDVYDTFTILAGPDGDLTPIPDEPGGYEITNVQAPQGTGATVGLDVYTTDPYGVNPPTYLGTIDGLSFLYDPDGVPDSGDEYAITSGGVNCLYNIPFLQLGIDLYTASEACPADQNGDGAFNNTDINLFVTNFISQDPAADINGDGNWNNTDINLFVTLFISNCA